MPGVLYVALQFILMHREVTGICWDCFSPLPQEIARARVSGDRVSLPPIQTGAKLHHKNKGMRYYYKGFLMDL